MVAVIVFLLTLGRFNLPVQFILAWNGFTLATIVLARLRIIFADAPTAVRTAKLQDTGRTAIFIFVIAGAVASLFAVLALLGSAGRIRTLALVHGMLSFLFSTVILALAINLASGLIGGVSLERGVMLVESCGSPGGSPYQRCVTEASSLGQIRRGGFADALLDQRRRVSSITYLTSATGPVRAQI